MTWHSVNDILPPANRRVLVAREIYVETADGPLSVPAYDIGTLEGTKPSDRWRLDSQMYSPLPLEPMLQIGIVTHWTELPELPDRRIHAE